MQLIKARKETEDYSILSLGAAAVIAGERPIEEINGNKITKPLKRQCYIIDSLKPPG